MGRLLRLLRRYPRLDDFMLYLATQEMRRAIQTHARMGVAIYKIGWLIDMIGEDNLRLLVNRLRVIGVTSGFSVSLRGEKLIVHFHPRKD